MRIERIPLKIAPRHDRQNGVDYGADGKILVDKEGVCLVWRSGSNCWHGMGGTQYHPTTLNIQNLPGERCSRTIHVGGRLSRRLISDLSDRIDAVFGEGVSSKIEPSQTLVVCEREAKESGS